MAMIKAAFKSLNYYAIPSSILLIVRKRLNFLFYVLMALALLIVVTL